MTLEKVQEILGVISISFTGDYTTEQELAKEALTELSAYIARLESEELVDEVAEAIATCDSITKDEKARMVGEATNGVFNKDAKAAIDVIKGKTCSTNA